MPQYQDLELVTNKPQRVRIVFADEKETKFGPKLVLKVVVDGKSQDQNDLYSLWTKPTLASVLIAAGGRVQQGKYGKTYRVDQQAWWIVEKKQEAGDKWGRIELELEGNGTEPPKDYDDTSFDVDEETGEILTGDGVSTERSGTFSEAGPGMPVSVKATGQAVKPAPKSPARSSAAPATDAEIVALFKDSYGVVMALPGLAISDADKASLVNCLFIGRQKVR